MSAPAAGGTERPGRTHTPGGPGLDAASPDALPGPHPPGLHPPDSVAAGRSRRQRLESWAWLLPLFGGVLFASPLVRAFAIDLRALGAPLIMIYIFGVWFALIIAAVVLARIDRRDDADVRAPRLGAPQDGGETLP